TGDRASTSIGRGVGSDGLTWSTSGPTSPGSCSPRCTPPPTHTQLPGSVTTIGKLLVTEQTEDWPTSELSGSPSGRKGQFPVTSALSLPYSGSSCGIL